MSQVALIRTPGVRAIQSHEHSHSQSLTLPTAGPQELTTARTVNTCICGTPAVPDCPRPTAPQSQTDGQPEGHPREHRKSVSPQVADTRTADLLESATPKLQHIRNPKETDLRMDVALGLPNHRTAEQEGAAA